MAASIQDFHFTSGDGLNLYCRLYETGAATRSVLCLPGLTRNSRDFETLARHLQARGYRVLTPDLRGRGHSAYDPDWRRYQPLTYVEDLWALLDTQAVRRCAIVGTSLGALLAMFMAAQHPEKIAGVVLNDAGPEIDGVGLARIAQYAGKQAPVASWEEAATQTEAAYGQALPGLTREQWMDYARRGFREDESGRPRPDLDPHIGTSLRANSGANAPDLWPLFAQIRDTPMLVVRGAFSDILSAATLARMAREKPDMKQFVVDNRGHAPLLDEPGCERAIDEFLDARPLW